MSTLKVSFEYQSEVSSVSNIKVHLLPSECAVVAGLKVNLCCSSVTSTRHTSLHQRRGRLRIWALMIQGLFSPSHH